MFHSFWRLLARSLRPSGPAQSRSTRKQAHPALEALEDRWMPNATTIGGFVYDDANNNGIMDSNETGVGGVGISLYHTDGTLVASTTTDANGQYVFASDPTVNVQPTSAEVDATFPSQPTDWSNSQSIAQFDPSLGTLTSVEIISTGTLNTDVQVENAAPPPSTTPQSANVDVQVAGQFTLSSNGTALVQSSTNTLDDRTDLGPYDGSSDFTGPDSHDFSAQQATANGTVTLNASSQDLSAFIGTGTLQLNETAAVTSTDSGSGNFEQSIRSTADGSVRIIYNYTPSNGLQTGDYYVEKTTEPSGYLDGQVTTDNITPLPNSYGQTKINVTLSGSGSSLTNNFAEVPPASLAGNVYHDLNANGSLDPGEPGLGATVTLTGTDVVGHTVSVNQQTSSDGSYSFNNLYPGTNYTITETTPPSGYLAPSVSVGSQGGTATATAVTQINLGAGVNGTNNNFGHVLPSSLAGNVYVDVNSQGVIEPGDPPLANVGITLTGIDNLGNAVFLTTNTAADGSYSFGTLRPGSYTISKAPPPGYLNGVDTPGSLGGTTANDQLFVSIGENQNGISYNFGEVTVPLPPPPPNPNGGGPPVPPPSPPTVPSPPPDNPFSKLWFLS